MKILSVCLKPTNQSNAFIYEAPSEHSNDFELFLTLAILFLKIICTKFKVTYFLGYNSSVPSQFK